MDENRRKITVEASINATPEELWEYLTVEDHIVKWNHASDDWHTTRAVNDLRVGGSFNFRMEAKDGSYGFDFSGIYDEVTPFKSYSYTLGDNRKVDVKLIYSDSKTQVIYVFDAETVNSVEAQKEGWQAILDNFKKYVESKL